MKRVFRSALWLPLAMSFIAASVTIAAAQTASSTPDPLVQVLVKKGVLTKDEAKTISGTPTQQRERLMELLQKKGVISSAEYKSIEATAPAANSTNNESQANAASPAASKPEVVPAAYNAQPEHMEKKEADSDKRPFEIRYKGLTLSPGGFATADFYVRQRNENSDTTSNFGALPFGGISNSHLTEFRASAKGSRISLLGEGKAGSTKIRGYFEGDFMNAAPVSNQVETNAFPFRVRQAWGQAETAGGLTFTAGQMWSLMTTDRKGIATLAEFIPNTIEASYVIGYTYVRQTSARITKNFNDRVWAAFEVANSETTFASSFTPDFVMGLETSANATSPFTYLLPAQTTPCPLGTAFQCNPAPGLYSAGVSTNMAPDLIAKVAFEPGWGHFEIKALGRFFRDRIVPSTAPSTAKNNVTEGGGIGWGMILPLKPKKADFLFEGLVGEGIGRYGAALLPDVTIRPSDGALVPLKELHIMAGLELHPRPKLDLYLYGGDEYVKRAVYPNPTSASKPAGYGSPLVNNTNCTVELLPTSATPCQAQNKNLWEGTAALWYTLYHGNFGAFRYGLQYEYLYRTTYSGLGGSPKGLDNVVLTSFRYFLP